MGDAKLIFLAWMIFNFEKNVVRDKCKTFFFKHFHKFLTGKSLSRTLIYNNTITGEKGEDKLRQVKKKMEADIFQEQLC